MRMYQPDARRVRRTRLAGKRRHALVLAAIAIAALLSACEFDPNLPTVELNREVGVGVRPHVGRFGGDSLAMHVASRGVSENELVELSVAIGSALHGDSANPTADVSYSHAFGDARWVDVRVRNAWTPALATPRIDPAAARAAAAELGFDLTYLHWCPPYEYEIEQASPQSLSFDSTYGCILWEAPEDFAVASVTLGSERSALGPNLVFFAFVLAAATWTLAVFVNAGVRRRPVRLEAALVGIGAWVGGIMLYGAIVALLIPDPATIVAIEPGSTTAGRLLDNAATLAVWPGLVAGLVAIGLAVVVGLGALVASVVRRFRTARN